MSSMKPVSTTKRNRTSSGSSNNSRQHLAHKSTRISASPPAEESPSAPTTSHPLLCTLPPTCNHKPTPLANTKELESHYATYHAHVCEQPACGCVFPDGRLLELHQTENHDPISAMRKERGEKIFACHLTSCSRNFANPKARRLHLISTHGYPKEYFFAVTNKGVGGLLKKWGEGASMVRGKWSARDPPAGQKGNPGVDNPLMEVDKETMREKMDVDEDDSDDEEEEEDGSSSEDEQASTNPKIHTTGSGGAKPSDKMSLDQDPEATPRPPVSSCLPPSASPPSITKPLKTAASTTPADPDSLSVGFSSLSLVPPSVRFGRGGRAGFAHPGGARPPHQRQPSQPEVLANAKSIVGTHARTADNGKAQGGGNDRPNRGRGGTTNRGRGESRGRGRVVPSRGGFQVQRST